MNYLKYIGFLLGVFYLTACNINKNLMFREPQGEITAADSIPLKPTSEYTITQNDLFEFQLFTNNGEKIIDGMNGINPEIKQTKTITYVVRSDGTSDLPLLGAVHLEGLTIKKCEDTLSKLYLQKGFLDPYIQVKITNSRVIVFTGNGADAKVVNLQNNNTTLMEVIALAGGIADRGKSEKVKLMRVDNGTRKVYTMDLSTIDGLKYADLIVQANDYIYIEPREQVAKEFLNNTAPILSLFTSVLVIFTVITTLK
jgi:polysaccharide export outer membrane protein